MSFLPAETFTIEGPDAIAFAHAQLSSDVRALAVGCWQWSAWLDPQGRVRALAQVMRPAADRLHVLLRGGTAAALVAALQPYVLRSRVTLAALPRGMLVDAPAATPGSVSAGTGEPVLGMGSYAVRIASEDASAQACSWRLAAIQARHPWLPDAALGTLLAPSLGLQDLDAVSLSKGCFPGQEIVARLHFRGGCKQHLHHLVGSTKLTPGRKLHSSGKAVGIILDSTPDATSTMHALAVLRDAAAHASIALAFDDGPESVRCLDPA